MKELLLYESKKKREKQAFSVIFGYKLVRQEYRAVVEGNVFLAADVEEDEIQAVLIPFARKMAYCCATFVDAETLLELSANEDGIQPDAEVAEEREEISELSAFLATDE
ncbi:hypothetical protein Ddc_21908 [Ditylenchus destructor]|nr:hypothetical protein Ddc_21908 [Ditylenchus destructor]